jgi:hypothetical protein
MRYAMSTNSMVEVNGLVRIVFALLHAGGPVDKHEAPERIR